VRHVGLTESIAMIADALHWKLQRITDRDRAEDRRGARRERVPDRGARPGVRHHPGRHRLPDGEPVIRLHMEAYLGAPESYDSVDIEGTPPLSMKIAGGIHGDIATSSMVVNSLPAVLRASPGLHTMRTLAIPSWYAG
jgi:2,4-diaminopentanoate dehydrogenase